LQRLTVADAVDAVVALLGERVLVDRVLDVVLLQHLAGVPARILAVREAVHARQQPVDQAGTCSAQHHVTHVHATWANLAHP